MPDISQLQTRLASALQITFAEAGKLAERLVPVITVDDIQQLGDSADLATRHAMISNAATGAAALASVALSNPAGSGMRMVVDQMILSTDTTGEIFGGAQALSTVGSAARGVYVDGGPGVPVGISTAANIVSAGLLQYDQIHLADTPTVIPFRVVLQPNNEFIIQAAVTVRLIRVSFFWKEIKLPRVV